MTTGTTGAASGGGWINSLTDMLSGAKDKLAENPDMLRWVALNAAKGFGAGNPFLEGMADTGMGMQRTKSSMGLMEKLLSGMPEGGQFKYSPEKGANITLPAESMAKALSGDPLDINTSMADLGVDTSKAIKPLSTEGAGTSTVNPTQSQQGQGLGLSDFSLNDLAGMTPEDFNSAMDMAAKFKELTTPKSSDRFPVPIPGIGYVTPEIWKTMPDKEKNYALYVDMAMKLGDDDIMDRREFDQMTPTEQGKFVAELRDSKELRETYEWMQGVEAVPIMKSLARLQQEQVVAAGMEPYREISTVKFLEDINKELNSDFTRVLEYQVNPQQKVEDAFGLIISKVEASGGTVRPKGKFKDTDKVIPLIVEFPNGETREIKFRPEYFKPKED